MREDLAPLVSIVLFLWSLWAFYSGNYMLAFYLIAAAIYVTIALATVFVFSIDSLADRIDKSIERLQNRGAGS